MYEWCLGARDPSPLFIGPSSGAQNTINIQSFARSSGGGVELLISRVRRRPDRGGESIVQRTLSLFTIFDGDKVVFISRAHGDAIDHFLTDHLMTHC